MLSLKTTLRKSDCKYREKLIFGCVGKEINCKMNERQQPARNPGQ